MSECVIIGAGMLAQEFSNCNLSDEIVLFASGVSNSNETSLNAFNRERALLFDTIQRYPEKKLIYFSTCSMYDNYFKNNAYTLHKLNMEAVIENSSIDFIVFRLPQVLGSNNKSQLIGFLFDRIKTNKHFDLYDVERNIIDISDVSSAVSYIINNDLFSRKKINIANPRNIKVIDLVKKIETIYNWTGRYNVIKKSGQFDIDTTDIKPIFLSLNINFGNYIEEKMRKYY